MLRPLIARVRRLLKPSCTILATDTRDYGGLTPENAGPLYALPRLVSVYAYLPCTASRIVASDRQALPRFFADKLDKLKLCPVVTPVFLQQKNALRYGRFRHPAHIIVKMVVPEFAVAGRANSLLIKPGVITLENVHGCFIGWNSQGMYLENPLFDAALMPISPPVTTL